MYLPRLSRGVFSFICISFPWIMYPAATTEYIWFWQSCHITFGVPPSLYQRNYFYLFLYTFTIRNAISCFEDYLDYLIKSDDCIEMRELLTVSHVEQSFPDLCPDFARFASSYLSYVIFGYSGIQAGFIREQVRMVARYRNGSVCFRAQFIFVSEDDSLSLSLSSGNQMFAS